MFLWRGCFRSLLFFLFQLWNIGNSADLPSTYILRGHAFKQGVWTACQQICSYKKQQHSCITGNYPLAENGVPYMVNNKKKENIETSDLGFQFWESCSCLDTQVRCCLCSLYSQELTLHKIAREHFSQSWHGTRTWRNHLTNGKLTNEKLHESGLWRAAALQEQKVSVSFERWRHKDIPDGSCISIACAGHA